MSTDEQECYEWFTPGRFAALLGLLIVVCFPQVVIGWESFFYLDYGHFAYPVAFYYRESFWRGEWPLWNPLNSCGIPFLAEWTTLTLYPLSLFYLLLPLPWSLGLFCLGHMFWAGLGMYFLAHRWTGNRLAASVAGTAFAFNGLTWYALMWPNNLAGLGWMPWVVLAVERAGREGRRWLILAALAAAMQLLSGAPEVSLLTWLLLGALGTAQFIRGEIPRWKTTGRMLCVGGWAAGLAAVQLLPFLDLLAHSQRSATFSSTSVARIEAMPLDSLANYLVPLFHSLPNPQGLFYPSGQTWIASYYLGAGIVALALTAMWKVRQRPVWLLTGLAGFSLWMALGSNGGIYDWFSRFIPVFGFMRFPVKFVLLITFVLPLLAAFGLNWLQQVPAENWRLEGRKMWGLALVLLGLMALVVGCAWKHPLTHRDFETTAGNAIVRALFLVLILGCVALLRWREEGKMQRLLQTGLVALLWLDVFTHTSNLSPTVPCSVLEPDTIRQFFKWGAQLKAGTSRALQSQGSLWRMLASGAANPELDTNARRLSLFMNYNLLDHAAKFDGFYSLDLKEYLEVFKQAYFTTNEAVRLKDFLGISLVNNPTNVVDWMPRNSFHPLVTAGQKPVYASPEETLRELLSDRFEPRRMVYLPWEAQSQVRVKDTANARIVSWKFAPHRWEIEVEADAPTMVVAAQTFYHPWQAYVDGKPTSLWRANYAFQALEVSSGRHQVSLVYEDKAFFWGAVLSLVSLTGCAGTWLAWPRRLMDIHRQAQPQ